METTNSACGGGGVTGTRIVADDGGRLPRERLKHHGVDALRDYELMAIVLGTGYRGHSVLEVARSVVEAHPCEQLLAMDVQELAQLKGIGFAKAGVLVAGFELARRGLQKGLGVLPTISNPSDAIPMVSEIKDERKEHFICLYLNARNQIIHKETVSIGSLSVSIVHPREVFLAAITHSASSIILAHNHPSGDVSPSRDDIDLTHRLMQVGDIMGIEVLDHIIVASGDFVSLKSSGVI